MSAPTFGKGSVLLTTLAICALTACSDTSATAAKTTAKPKTKVTKAKAAQPATKPSTKTGSATDLIDVEFDTPGKLPRPINEFTVEVTKPVTSLRMNITKLTYRGVVCGFSFRGKAPASPVTITMKGGNKTVRFDSGKIPVSWKDITSTETMTAGSASSNGWNFSAEAHPNRSGPGWVVSLGGVTGDGPNTVPTDVVCELHSDTPIDPASGPIGYWAGFAAV